MSLADSLLDGFSDDEIELESEIQNDSHEMKKFNIQDLLTIPNLNSISSIHDYCPILSKLEELEQKLKMSELEKKNSISNLDTSILTETNHMINDIYIYFNTLTSFVKLAYAPVWPDLSNIIKNPLFYIKIVNIIKFDIKSFKDHIINVNDSFNFLTKDIILSLTMSLNFLIKSNHSVIPNNHIQQLILEACEIMTNINDIQLRFRTFITKRIEAIAPNLTSLVGTTVASQLIATTGLSTLASTPACNIPSLGKSTNSISFGYVYNCDIIKNISNDFKKQAIRQISSKIVLCARIDQSGIQNGNMGLKWKEEIQKRLEKQMLPPENVQIKPLAKPVDMKSKKRGGRKFKKMRERMKMSEVEKAQNKMAFGEEELTKTDAFGEEIGLGMLGKTSIRNIENVRSVHVTKGTKNTLDKFSGKITKNSENKGSKLAELLERK